MLEVKGVQACYGAVTALSGIDIAVAPGEIVCIIGANGAGKTTLLNVISGVCPPRAGRVLFDGKPLKPGRPDLAVARGIVQVPEGRQVFAPLTVRENLEMGAFLRWKKERKQVESDLEEIFEVLPVLKERLNQLAGTLSGGEQQMLAIARGLMSSPRILLLDEPSLGLAPLLVQEIFGKVRSLPQRGCAVLLVEQNAMGALEVAQRGYVLTNGRITSQGTTGELAGNGKVKEAFLGRRRAAAGQGKETRP